MNKIKNTLKIKGYDQFKCTADKCNFTCCRGWDINVDTKTYNKWREKDNLNYILDNVRFVKSYGENKYLIKKETKGGCPFLSNEGLCNIVINHGDEYLSSTCRTFPRIENDFEDVKELTLSCSCPEVVNIISDMKDKIYIDFNESLSYIEELGCLKIRESLVNILQKEDISIENKLIISYDMLFNMLNSDDLTYEDLIELLEKYKSKNYIKEELDKYKEYENKDTIGDLKEINSLFIDIIENYRNVSIFKEYLKDIYNFTEKISIKNLFKEWNNFKDLFKKYDNLIENCIVSKVLSNCTSDDLEEMIISFEIIILEYLLIRHALFLRYCINVTKEINIQEIKDYVVIFSRIIGNNSEAVIEFLLDMFESEILEFNYISALILS
ncbi:flagellin lysine-N-methylase [Clostridium sp. Sa3CUN1]|uniref:Flagellin lysine-N-methylase n=1 Tax=Clostridium gallinarum TaxID=2762246 RepID=A0ABR8Q4D3_9CLOT|nr:flagellin lysine-N-methylase [Clostridium gallinarum]MBD7915292.1 flagellin lysine-N-methylase [Clostridium gallinarum]